MEATSDMDLLTPQPLGVLPAGSSDIEMVFSFDTTGSMSECLDHLRGQLSYVIERLFADIPRLRIAVVAHGDYCDLDFYGYVTKYVDFTNDVAQLCNFVMKVDGTGGGDFEECYELVLRQVREQLSWKPGTQRALVMIGDATPHDVNNHQNRDHIDWRVEKNRLLNELGVHVYGVQCLNNPEADEFYSELALSTGGRHLKLADLASVIDMMMAVCYREHGVEHFEAYEKEVRGRDGAGMRAELDHMFDALRDRIVPQDALDSASLSSGDSVPADHVNPQSIFGDGTTGGDLPRDDAGPNLDIYTPPPTPGSTTKPTKVVRQWRRKRLSSESSTSSRRSSRRSSIRTRSMTHPMILRARPKRLGTEQKRKQVSLPRKETIKRLLREEITGRKFSPADLEWSSWRPAMAKTEPRSGHWESRHGDQPGVRNARLFDDNMDVPAVYEVAVQLPESGVKIPVLNKVTVGFQRHWDGALFSPRVRSRVNRVLSRGCKVYVRRAILDTGRDTEIRRTKGCADADSADHVVRELRSLIGQTYDYAWRDRYDVKTRKYSQRTITRNSCRI